VRVASPGALVPPRASGRKSCTDPGVAVQGQSAGMDFDLVILVGLALVPGAIAALIGIQAWQHSDVRRSRKHSDNK
jgi:hypothetical protein